MAIYRIFVGTGNTGTMARKQEAILAQWVAGGGALTKQQVADAATKGIGIADVVVSAADVGNFAKALREQEAYKAIAAGLPAFKAGQKKGRQAAPTADSGQLANFLKALKSPAKTPAK